MIRPRRIIPSFSLETLESRTLLATVPAGFSETIVASGISAPTAMQFAPDGRLFVASQTGQLRVISSGGVLQPNNFVTLDVDSNGERGLLGVAFDPNFANNHFVYVYYTAKTPTIHNRISRFIANGDTAVAGSEVVLFDLDDLGAANHNGGALNFGPDGKLYAAVGENGVPSNAQSLSNVLGKMLRLNSDGSIPTDNPFYNTASGKNRAIWALGLRNPFTFTFQPGTGRMFINDVGDNGAPEEIWEEIDEGARGANYGWPTTGDGTFDPNQFPGLTNPRFNYNHTEGVAITGGAFYNPTTNTFPSQYAGDYFFADFGGGWIRNLNLPDNTAPYFATNLAQPVDLKVASNGSLYYLERGNGGRVGKIQFTQSQGPSITSPPASTTVPEGAAATFSVAATGTAPLSYQWQRNSVNIPGATASTYSLNNVSASDNLAKFRVIVSNAISNVTSNEATLTVTPSASGNGLTGVYYDNANFTGPLVTRVDPTVNFNFGLNAPIAGIGADTFSVRWTGQVLPQFSQTYTFSTLSDDGVRLWVNGQLVINNFSDHAAVENSGSITLVAGQKYDIRVDYFDNARSAVMQLSWASASQIKQIIPQSRLFTTSTANAYSSTDIGAPAPAGSTTVIAANRAYDISGGGSDIYGTSDQFRFASRSITGNFDLKVRLESLGAIDPWTKAGLMARESLAANSRNVFAMATPSQYRFTQRTTAGGDTLASGAGPVSYPNTWIRLRRTGNTFDAFRSTDGINWTSYASTTVALSNTLFVGLAVTSHKQGVATLAKFRDLA